MHLLKTAPTNSARQVLAAMIAVFCCQRMQSHLPSHTILALLVSIASNICVSHAHFAYCGHMHVSICCHTCQQWSSPCICYASIALFRPPASLPSAHVYFTAPALQVSAERLAWSMAREHNIDVVSIHPSLILGTAYSPQKGVWSVECMRVSPTRIAIPYSYRLCVLYLLTMFPQSAKHGVTTAGVHLQSAHSTLRAFVVMAFPCIIIDVHQRFEACSHVIHS